MDLRSLPHSLPPGAVEAPRPHDGGRCPSCINTASRLHALEAATDDLRRELALGARRLRVVMGRLALAEERAGHCRLAGALRSVAAGQSNLSFDDVSALLTEQVGQVGAVAPCQCLSAREREVLRLITESQRTPAIAARLGITVATVEVHRRNIMRKLGLHTVAALTKYALREGLTSL